MTHFETFTYNVLGVNAYLIWDDETRQAAIIDCAMQFPEERAQFQQFVASHELHLVAALQTHTHFDHIFGVPFIHDTYGLTPLCHKADFSLYAQLPQWMAQFGTKPEGHYPPLQEDIKDNQVLHIGTLDAHALHTPGHTPGGVSFYIPQLEAVFTGDTLFAGSVGRSDFPGGDYEQELQSVRQRLFTLPPQTQVLPGHGPSSTIDREIHTNPYF